MTLKKKMIYSELFNLDIFIHNNYFKAYVQLMINNINNAGKYLHKHHIIPKFYYLKNNLTVDNSNSNLVKLTYQDHVRAHFYLCKCITEFYFASAVHSFNILYNKNYYNLTEDELNYYLPFQEELISSRAILLGEHNKGGVYIFKDTIVKHINTTELDSYLSTGWYVGNPNAGHGLVKNSIWITNGIINKRIKEDELKFYIEKGYIKGRSNFVKVNKDNGRLGKIYMNNGTKNILVLPTEIDKYISSGYTIGAIKYGPTGKRSKEACKNIREKCGVRGKKIMNKDGIIIFVLPEKTQEYLELGWSFGRKSKNV